ncbi:uncharacterized protein V1510DRAFT_417838 [Dipodascopsis tothii]|uniref:uncharacterized protein n=1 Tax=Dipodascopsis tothii TaxID=44089 RepID=UPI0034CEAA8A
MRRTLLPAARHRQPHAIARRTPCGALPALYCRLFIVYGHYSYSTSETKHRTKSNARGLVRVRSRATGSTSTAGLAARELVDQLRDEARELLVARALCGALALLVHAQLALDEVDGLSNVRRVLVALVHGLAALALAAAVAGRSAASGSGGAVLSLMTLSRVLVAAGLA